MNQGVVQRSFVQQMAAAGSPHWWSINNNTQPPPYHQHHSLLAALSRNHTVHHLTPPLTAPPSRTDSLDHQQSWSRPVSGLVGEEDTPGMSHMQAKNLENWEQLLNHTSNADVKQPNSSATSYVYGPANVDIQKAANSSNCLSPQMVSASPSRSRITTSSMRNGMLGFSAKSSEISVKRNDNTTAVNGGVAKKARIQTSSAQSGIKVRKEKLGDRITALHQLVSPFGKTDTASVLLEAIGYIRFLQHQIEALSHPYLCSGSSWTTRRQQPAKRVRCSLFPEDPGQLLNDDKNMKRKAISEQECEEEQKKDLRSRGLCLVPISCTVDVGSENGADYWTQAVGGNFHQLKLECKVMY